MTAAYKRIADAYYEADRIDEQLLCLWQTGNQTVDLDREFVVATLLTGLRSAGHLFIPDLSAAAP